MVSFQFVAGVLLGPDVKIPDEVMMGITSVCTRSQFFKKPLK